MQFHFLDEAYEIKKMNLVLVVQVMIYPTFCIFFHLMIKDCCYYFEYYL
jgi:hypothetical protein